jgi:hypothetical protein
MAVSGLPSVTFLDLFTFANKTQTAVGVLIMNGYLTLHFL